MATNIKKNTAKLMMQKLQSELDALFAEQQVLNGNSKGKPQRGLPKAQNGWPYYSPGEATVTGDYPYHNAGEVTINGNNSWWPQGGLNALGTIANNYTPNLYGGSFPNVNVTGNYPYHSAGEATVSGAGNASDGYPYHSAGEAAVTGSRRTPSDFWNNTGINPYNFYNGSNSAPQSQQPAQAPSTNSGYSTPGYKQMTTTGMGYTIPSDHTSGRPFGDPYEVDFGIPELSNNAAWSQKPSAVYGSAQSKPAGTGVPTPVKPTTGSTSLKESKPKGFTANTSNLKIPTFGTGANPLMNLKGDNFKLAGTGPKSATPAEGTNWGKVGTFAGQVAPMLYNMFKGLQKPEKTTPNYNPYEDEIRSTMRNRRFNIDPILNANRTAQAVSNRNISNVANSRGELMSNLGASQNYRMTGDAAAYAQKNNMDNQYLGEQAQMDANLGANRAQMDWGVQTANSQNRAATNSFLGQGFNDLGRFAQTQQLMNNQQMRDAQLAGLYPDMFGVYNYMNGAKNIVNSTVKKRRNG